MASGRYGSVAVGHHLDVAFVWRRRGVGMRWYVLVGVGMRWYALAWCWYGTDTVRRYTRVGSSGRHRADVVAFLVPWSAWSGP